MRLPLHKLLLISIIGWLVTSLVAPVARAEDVPVTLGVSPAISEILINRGQSVQRDLLVENKAATPVALRVHSENFEASDPYGAITFNTDNTRQYASSSWIKLTNPGLILNPGQRTTLSLTISCPPDAEPGGHYATVFLEPVSAVATGDNSTIGVSQRVGALLFITVNGDNREQGNVLGAATNGSCTSVECSFKTDGWREWGPVPFTFEFENTGNVHVKVDGIISVKDVLGRNAGEVEVAQKTVLPGSSRHFQITWPREILFGKYTATLTLTYGTLRRSETAHVSFWVIPWRTIAVAVILLLSVGLVILLRKYRKKRPTH